MDRNENQQENKTVHKHIQDFEEGQEQNHISIENEETVCPETKESDMPPEEVNEDIGPSQESRAEDKVHQEHQGDPLPDLHEKLPNEMVEESKKATYITFKKRLFRLYAEHKRIFIGLGIAFSILLLIYLGLSEFFKVRYYFGTIINGVSVSGKTVVEAQEIMDADLAAYTLRIKERGGKIQEIKADEIGLQYQSKDDLDSIQASQNPYHWVGKCFNHEGAEKNIGYAYNEKQFKERVDQLSCLKEKNIIEPQNPTFQYGHNGYEIIDEIPGNRIDPEKLTAQISRAVLQRDKELDLESAGCYINPQYTTTSQKTLENQEQLNRYASTKITYDFGNPKVVLEGDQIKDWLAVNEDFEVECDQEKVKEYVDKIAQQFDTLGKTRKFTTASGKTIKVGGGDYGWAMDRSKETKYLIAAISQGKNITRKPEYRQTAFGPRDNDIGNTYVEIHLGGQHIWFYKKGKLIVHGDIVTGNVSKNHTTPKGIYQLKYKAKNVVLRGPDYASPVTFWMPFNGGIGIHDASWRSKFGGNIYRTNGSHGCINCPYNVAKAIYNNIEPNTPVICY